VKAYFAASEVARILGVSEKTAREYCASGKIESETTDLENYPKISYNSLSRYLTENKIPLEQIDTLKKKKIKMVLVVDDDAAILLLLENILKEKYHNLIIETADNGFTANVKAQILAPDVLITDLKMPKLGGIELCRNLRAREVTRNVAIVVTTGFSTQENIAGLKELNIKKVLVKPFTVQSVISALDPLLG